MTRPQKAQFIKQLQYIRAQGYSHLSFRNFVYVNTKTNGTILCTKHNCEFSQNFNNLKKGYGCPECNEERKVEAKVKRKIKKAKKVKMYSKMIKQWMKEDEDMRRVAEQLVKG